MATYVGSQGEVDTKLFDNARKLLGSDNGKAVDIDEVNSFVEAIRHAPPPHGDGADMLGNLQKGASGGMVGLMNDFFTKLGDAMPDLAKEVDFNTFTNAIPSALGFNVFDLTGPSRMTYPVMSPIRNRIPRVDGRGPAHLAKIITGVNGSGTGGIGSLNPAFNVQVPLAGSNVEASRGNAISYAQADSIVPFKWHSIYDAVTWPAFFSGQGFQDLRALSATVLMQIGMMAEERAILMGRDTILAAPTISLAAARTKVGSETGLDDVGGGHTKLYVKVTAVGPFGDSAPSAASTATLSANNQCVDVTITDVTGALAYNVYVSRATNGGADPGDGSRFLWGTTGFNKFTIGATGIVSSGNTVPAVDTGTGGSNNYRGLIQTLEEGPASGTSILGYSRRYNAKPAGTSVTFLQDAFSTMWNTAKADPEEIWLHARERRSMSDLIQAASSSAYRVTLAPNDQIGVLAGVIVNSVVNESTGRVVKLTVHPWLPVGNAILMSYSLPFATAYGQTTTCEIVGPQDFMQTSWPITSERFESSLSWFNALAVYGPTFCGVIHGIAQNDEVTTAGAMQ